MIGSDRLLLGAPWDKRTGVLALADTVAAAHALATARWAGVRTHRAGLVGVSVADFWPGLDPDGRHAARLVDLLDRTL